MRYCLFFYWRNFICARNKFLWINKITSLRDLRNVPNYFFLWEVNLKDLTSSQIEKTSSQYCFDTLTNTKLRMFFKGEKDSFSSDDWASVFYFLNINLIGLRSQNISENKKKWCNFASSIFDVATNLIFISSMLALRSLIPNAASFIPREILWENTRMKHVFLSKLSKASCPESSHFHSSSRPWRSRDRSNKCRRYSVVTGSVRGSFL